MNRKGTLKIKIQELPETERPYEKLELYGAKRLSNAELLAIIIKSGTKEETSVQLAQKILNMNQSTNMNDLNFLQEISIEEFMEIKGIGKIKAIQLKAISELAIRMNKPTNYRKVVIKEPFDLAKILMNELRYEKREIVKTIILNNKNEILKISDVALGGSNFANTSIKDVLTETIKMQAPKLIVVHNHPSGDSKPSKSDIEFTSKLGKAADMFEIELLDHLIIGDMQYTSIFSEMIKAGKFDIYK